MGTMIQRLHASARPSTAASASPTGPSDLKGNNDLLTPHPAGRDPRDPPGLPRGRRRPGRDQHLQRAAHLAGRLRHAGARLRAQLRVGPAGPRRVRRGHARPDPSRPRFVAGALGPTNRTASISPDVNDPGARNVTYDELVEAYLEQANGLVDGGADVLLIETIFDTLNAKAAIFARRDAVRGARPPLAGDDLGHDHRRVRAHPVRPGHRGVLELGAPRPPLLVGLNCALGAAEMRPYLAEIARIADCFVSCYPNAGLPNAFGEYDEAPDQTAAIVREFADERPGQHARRLLRHDARAHRARWPRWSTASRRACRAERPCACRLSGLEPLTITRDSLFVNVGERTNITGSAKFRNLIRDGDYDSRAVGRAPAGRERRADHRRQHGRGHDRRRRGDGPLRQAHRQRARHQPGAGDGRFLEVRGDRGRAALRPGQADRQLDLDEGGRGEVPSRGDAVPQVRRGGRRHGLRRGRAGRQPRAAQGDLRARLPHPGRRGRLPGRGHHLRPEHLRGGDRHRGARQLRRRLHRGHPLDQGRTCPARWCPAACRTCRSPSAATTRCARRSTRCSSITRSRPAWTWASSTPAPWSSTTRSTRGCASASRTSSSTAAPTRPSGCSRSRPSSPATARRPRRVDDAWRELPVDERITHALVKGIDDYAEVDTEELRALDRGARRPADRGHRGPADGRHERRR